jgi:hypothetical protein
MRRLLSTGLFLVLLAGCQSLQDQDALRPLPETGPKPNYIELLLRARRQSDVILDRSFRNLWIEVEEAARALEQTAKLMPTSEEAPAKKPETVKLWTALGANAKKLGTAAREMEPLTGAAKEKKLKEIDDLILQIGRDVRTLRAMI